MEKRIKYSICGTVYNSAEVIEEAIKPLLNLGDEVEVIITDNKSRDGTYEILKKYEPKVKTISLKCSRGLGRNKAIESAQGDIIIIIDFDVAIFNISNVISFYEKNNFKDYLLLIIPPKMKCNSNLMIGTKEIFNYIGGYPDLNFGEDIYLWKKAEAVGVLRHLNFDLEYKCLEIKGKLSGSERRYEKNLFKLLRRRIIHTRDDIFVMNFNFEGMMEWDKLKGIKKYYLGIPLYLSGKILTSFIKVPRVEEEIERIKKDKRNFLQEQACEKY